MEDPVEVFDDGDVGAMVPVSNGVATARLPPKPAMPAAPVDEYVKSFQGMSTEPFSKEAAAILGEPVDDAEVDIRTDGIVYLPGVFYRRRLTRAFGAGGWALVPRGPVRTRPAGGGGDLVVYDGALFVLGRFVSAALGQCTYWPNNGGMTYADAAEGAKTDALTRCCKDLGIAWELWDPKWRKQWQEKYAACGSDRKWGLKSSARPSAKGNSASRPASTAATKPATAAGTAAAVQTAAPGPSTGDAPAGIHRAANDSGEAPSDEQLAELDELVFQKLGWKRDFAVIWIAKRFGVSDPGALTLAQVGCAFRLLYAWGDKERYEAQVKKEAEAGNCRP